MGYPSSSQLSNQLMDLARSPQLRGGLDPVLVDYCHQCRNRLNSLKLSIYLAKRLAGKGADEPWNCLERLYQSLESQFDLLQQICRPMRLSPVEIELGLLIEDRRADWSRVMARRGRELNVERQESQCVACFDVYRVGEALDALVDWRAEQGGITNSATICWWLEADRAHIKWVESTEIPIRKLANSQARGETRLEPLELDLKHAAELTSCLEHPPCWALARLTRVIQEHGGEIQIEEKEGWCLRISWPVQSNKIDHFA